MTRNDLADPYVLGVSSGASTGAVIAIIWGWFSFLGEYNVSSGAFIGAAISTLIVTICAGKSSSPVRLILVGMGVSALFSSLTMMIIYGARHEAQVRSAMFWLLGSLSGMKWGDLASITIPVFLMAFFLWLIRNDLDLMLLGEGEAEYLGPVSYTHLLAVSVFYIFFKSGKQTGSCCKRTENHINDGYFPFCFFQQTS